MVLLILVAAWLTCVRAGPDLVHGKDGGGWSNLVFYAGPVNQYGYIRAIGDVPEDGDRGRNARYLDGLLWPLLYVFSLAFSLKLLTHQCFTHTHTHIYICYVKTPLPRSLL